MAFPDRPLNVISCKIPPGTTIEFRPSPGETVHICAPADGDGLVVRERIEYDDETGRHIREQSTVIPEGAFGINTRGDNTVYSYTRAE